VGGWIVPLGTDGGGTGGRVTDAIDTVEDVDEDGIRVPVTEEDEEGEDEEDEDELGEGAGTTTTTVVLVPCGVEDPLVVVVVGGEGVLDEFGPVL